MLNLSVSGCFVYLVALSNNRLILFSIICCHISLTLSHSICVTVHTGQWAPSSCSIIIIHNDLTQIISVWFARPILLEFSNWISTPIRYHRNAHGRVDYNFSLQSSHLWPIFQQSITDIAWRTSNRQCAMRIMSSYFHFHQQL